MNMPSASLHREPSAARPFAPAWDDGLPGITAPRLRPSTVYSCEAPEFPAYVFRSEGFAEDLGSEYETR